MNITFGRKELYALSLENLAYLNMILDDELEQRAENTPCECMIKDPNGPACVKCRYTAIAGFGEAEEAVILDDSLFPPEDDEDDDFGDLQDPDSEEVPEEESTDLTSTVEDAPELEDPWDVPEEDDPTIKSLDHLIGNDNWMEEPEDGDMQESSAN